MPGAAKRSDLAAVWPDRRPLADETPAGLRLARRAAVLRRLARSYRAEARRTSRVRAQALVAAARDLEEEARRIDLALAGGP